MFLEESGNIRVRGPKDSLEYAKFPGNGPEAPWATEPPACHTCEQPRSQPYLYFPLAGAGKSVLWYEELVAIFLSVLMLNKVT